MQIKQHDDNAMDYFGITAGKRMLGSEGAEQRVCTAATVWQEKQPFGSSEHTLNTP